MEFETLLTLLKNDNLAVIDEMIVFNAVIRQVQLLKYSLSSLMSLTNFNLSYI